MRLENAYIINGTFCASDLEIQRERILYGINRIFRVD